MSCWCNLGRTILIAVGLFLLSGSGRSASASTITDGGLLTGSFDNINLNVEGTLDFVQWGDQDVEDFDRKASTAGGTTPVGSIEDWIPLGGGSPNKFDYSSSPPRLGFSYAGAVDQDGVSSSHSDDPSGVYLDRESVGVGFRFRVEASGGDQTLKVYVGAYNATGQMTATLPGAGDFTGEDLLADNEMVLGIYTIHFKADQSGDFLTVDWKQQADYGFDQFYFSAAALAPEPCTLVLLSTSAIALLACAWRKRRRR